jgi:myosin-5
MNEFGKNFREHFNISKKQFIENEWENTLVWVKTSEKKQVSSLIHNKVKINNENKRRSSINIERKNRHKRSASVSCDVNNINKLEYEPGIISRIDYDNYKIFVSVGENTTCFLEKDIFPRNNSNNWEQDCNDLTSLYYLNEICVIDFLHKRYNKDIIYTFTGKILIAINPYKKLPIYASENASEDGGEENHWKPGDPHVYEIANRAYSSMVTLKENQSILVTGESGAGKTETTKILLQFFFEKSKLIQKYKNKNFENNLIGTTSILECFGNAKTLRNDNSSRFGKFIIIEFDDYGKIIGGKIDIYLLEKSRLISHTKGERNYHIFYQFIQKINKDPNFIDSLYNSSTEKINYLERWNLDNSTLQFDYLKPYGTYDNYKIDFDKHKETDITMFNNMLHSLISIGIEKQELIKIFDMIVSILHLGNINFFDNDKDEATIDINKQLNWNTWLGIENSKLFNIITTKDIIVGNEKYIKKLSSEESRVLRDTFSIYIYESLFMWIVRKINQSLSNNDKLYEINGYFIGILDIYGFESFQDNSFEQFCINYANEKLQNQFNTYFFHLEQQEYKKQGINIDYVHFKDNKECISMIENKYGILDILDEETRFPKATSQTLLLKLNSKLSKHPYFIYTNNKPNYFTIKHYADHVIYNIKNFLSKSKSTVLQFNIQDIKDSLVSKFFEIGINNIDTKQSVGLKFKNSLIDLMNIINNTDCHYIRCIKPNDTKSPNTFWSSRIIEQLKCGGVFEAIKISKTGYPNKLNFDSFINRYSILQYIYYLYPHISIKSINKHHTQLNKNLNKHLDKNLVKNINNILSIICETLSKVDYDYNFDDKYKIGKDKIFFKVGIIPSLEEYRKQIINKSANSIQNIIRMKQSKDFMKNKLDAIILY